MVVNNEALELVITLQFHPALPFIARSFRPADTRTDRHDCPLVLGRRGVSGVSGSCCRVTVVDELMNCYDDTPFSQEKFFELTDSGFSGR